MTATLTDAYDLPQEFKDFRDTIRQIVRERVAPRAAEIDATGEYPWDVRKLFGEQDLMGLPFAEEHGGTGTGTLMLNVAIEEVARACASSALILMIQELGTLPIQLFGSDEQKDAWLPRCATGEWSPAFCLSEPEAGSDPASMRTTAVQDGDEWVINGTKMWNTMAHMATHNWVALRTEPDAPKHKGISMMIVPMDRPGITVQPLWTWSGIRTNAVFFDDVRVPRDNLIGERGMGFYYAMMALDFERIMIGSVGLLRRFLGELKTFVRRTRRDGRPLGAVPWVRRALADLEMRVEVGRQIGLLNAWLIDQGEVPTKEGSIAKVYVTELNAHLASVGMEILGLAGQLAADDPAAPLHGRLQWLYTTAPLQRFGGGTNEIQRCIIAQRGLGLPRK
jgi:alkylation response protein AidB-like acyl-CoA dehydrogenase